jgi:single-strand DNA-binding protein
MNKVILIGRVGKTPEIKEINGAKCAIFSLATSERYKDKNGNAQEITEWHNIVVWRATAEYCEKYVSVGDSLCIEGKIKYRTWENDRGEKRYATDIVADHLQTLGRKAAQAGGDDDLPA